MAAVERGHVQAPVSPVQGVLIVASFSSFARALRPLTLRRRRDLQCEAQEELRLHLEMCVEANIANGMSSAQAREEAKQQTGDLEAIADACVREYFHRDTKWSGTC